MASLSLLNLGGPRPHGRKECYPPIAGPLAADAPELLAGASANRSSERLTVDSRSSALSVPTFPLIGYVTLFAR